MSVFKLAGMEDVAVEKVRLLISPSKRRQLERIQELIKLLQDDARMPCTEIGKRLHMPISTAFDYLKGLRRHYRLSLVLVEREDPGKPWKSNGAASP